MIEQAVDQLEKLAQDDATIAPLAWLQAEALRASADPLWGAGVPPLTGAAIERGEPLLHGQTLSVDLPRLHQLFDQLVAELQRSGHEAALPLRAAAEQNTFTLPELLRLSVMQATDHLLQLAATAGVHGALLATLGQILALPVLQACGRQAEPLLAGTHWGRGFCPVCAAWPLLAELRGLDRSHWLRCGRCGSGWQFPIQRCVYCGNDDFRTLGYLAPEAERDSRQAVTCDQCRGYLKTLATIRAMTAGDILLQDLGTLELDLAALERGYGRPEVPAFRLQVALEPRARRSLWLPWKR